MLDGIEVLIGWLKSAVETLNTRMNNLWPRFGGYKTYEVAIGGMPNNGTKSVPHGIPGFSAPKVRHIYGVVYNAGSSYPMGTTMGGVANGYLLYVSISGANVVVRTDADWQAYSGYVYIDYQN
jgi:hypothetical protein